MSHSRHRHAQDAAGRAGRKKVVIVAICSVAVIIAGIIVITQGIGTSPKHAAAVQPSASAAASASSAASHSQPHLRTAGRHHTSAPAATRKVRVVATYSGTGSRKTGGFTVLGTGDWVLRWSYHCPSSSTAGSFVVSEDGGFDENGVNVDEHGSAHHGQTRVFGDVGSHHLSVHSTCPWKVEVTGRW
jgi:hypothetical protein